MKRILILFIALIIGFGAFAKSDYKHPIESQPVAELVIQPTERYNTVKRDMYVAVDAYDNHFISINVNYFKNKGKDDLEVTFTNGDTATLELDKSIKVEADTYYYISDKLNVSKQSYYQFFSIYPISKEQYDDIKENGIKEIRVEGIYSIIIQ